MSPADESLIKTIVATIRSIVTYVAVSIYTIIAGVVGIILALAFNWPNALYRLGAWGVQLALFCTGIRYVARGTEHIAAGRAAVYCVNHTSNVEPPVIFLVLRALFPRLRILYKAEMHKIPILAWGFDIVGFVPVARRNREQSMRAIEQAAAALRDGYSFLIFPEGTRSRTGELLPFKKGGFIMAIKAQAPMVPIAVTGARDAMRKGSPILRPVTITVEFGAPVETAGLSLTDRDELIREVRARMEALLDESARQEPLSVAVE